MRDDGPGESLADNIGPEDVECGPACKCATPRFVVVLLALGATIVFGLVGTSDRRSPVS